MDRSNVFLDEYIKFIQKHSSSLSSTSTELSVSVATISFILQKGMVMSKPVTRKRAGII